jgi:hypothetical protein
MTSSQSDGYPNSVALVRAELSWERKSEFDNNITGMPIELSRFPWLDVRLKRRLSTQLQVAFEH